ncbi:MAG: YbjQ family protein [Gammaproteobacteria bacterium]
MLLTNLEQVPGKKIMQHYGLVQGNTIRAKHVGKDFLAGLKNIFGGELGAYTELLAESRQEATDRMIQQAQSMGANAIVNVRYSTSSVAQGAAELYAYGTAVKIDL